MNCDLAFNQYNNKKEQSTFYVWQKKKGSIMGKYCGISLTLLMYANEWIFFFILLLSLQVQERHDCTEFPHEQYKQFVTIPKWVIFVVEYQVFADDYY